MSDRLFVTSKKTMQLQSTTGPRLGLTTVHATSTCLSQYFISYHRYRRQLKLLVADGKGERSRCTAKLKQKWRYVLLRQDLQRYVLWRRSRCCRQNDT